MSNLNYEKVFETLVRETSNYLVDNHLSAMVLGISGGIDSTVVAAICHEVSKRTGIPLIGRSLPIKNKSDEFDVSRLVGEAFCNDFKVCNLGDIYRITTSQISILESNGNPGFTLCPTLISDGNIQARLRMTYLYNLASIYKGLVMSTDNQTEYQLGFWTIHGDVGDFDPLQDLWKTEVYELAKQLCTRLSLKIASYPAGLSKEYYKDTYNKYIALRESIALTPTDGLGISNSDLEQIGAKSYDEVDSILQDFKAFVQFGGYKEGTSLREIANSYLDAQQMLDVDVDTIIKVIDRHVASEFKRKKSPIYIKRELYDI